MLSTPNDRRFLSTALDSLRCPVMVLAVDGTVVAVAGDAPDQSPGDAQPLPTASVGNNYLQLCEGVAEEESHPARRAARGIREVLAGERLSYTLELAAHQPYKRRWLEMKTLPLQEADGVILAWSDVTALKLAQEALRGARDQSQRHMAHRTAELARANRTLRSELNERERTESELRLLQSLVLAVAEATDVTAAMVTVLERLCQITGWDYGEVWLPDVGETRLLHTSIHYTKRQGLQAFHAATEGRTFSRGEGLPGRVWQSRQAEWLDDLSDENVFLRARAARQVGLKTGVAVPIMSGDHVVAVMAFFLSSRRARDDRHLDLVSAAVAPLGTAIKRKQADEDLRALNQELERRVADRTEALRERESRLRAVLDTAADGIITSSDEGIIEAVNPAVAKMFGYGPAELVGQNVSVLVPDGQRRQHHHYVSAYPRDGRSKVIGIGRELEGQRRDGSRFPVELALTELYAGGRRHFTAIVRDISERKRAEEKLRQHQAELAHVTRLSTMGEMASGIAHELNQPLAAIATYSEACMRSLARERLDHGALKNTLERIGEQALRGGEIIRRLRKLVRKQGATRTEVSLNALVSEVLDLLAQEIRELDVRIHVDLAEDLPNVIVDAIQIEQILLNLVRNSLEAMRQVASRTLTIRTRPHGGDAARVTVNDTGVGLSEETLERAFEPFYTTRKQGLGMGLPISRSIAEAHDGRLWIESDPGRGTRVHLTLNGITDAATAGR